MHKRDNLMIMFYEQLILKIDSINDPLYDSLYGEFHNISSDDKEAIRQGVTKVDQSIWSKLRTLARHIGRAIS